MKHDFRKMSDNVCRCGAKIKLNVIERSPNIRFCYNCFMREVRKNPEFLKTAFDQKTKATRQGKHYNAVKDERFHNNNK
jgi:hypothetical protein